MKRLIFPLVLFLTYLILGIVTITNYGINWDEPAHFIRGQVFLRFLLTGKKDYAGLPEIDAKSYRQDFGYEFRDPNTNSTVRRSIYQHDDYGLVYYTQNVEKRGSHPAFSDVMSALFNYVLFVKLGIAPDVYSYNYYSIFVASLLVTGIYIWTKKYFGGFAAIVSTLSLALFPFFWAESHYNIKDVPETVFYALSVLVFYEAITSAKIKYIWYFAFVFAMAFATKFNALFILPTVLLWLFLRNFFLYRTSWREMFSFVKKNKAFLVFLVVPIIAVALWVLSFPAMLFEPRLIPASFSYYKTIGTTPVGNDWRYPLYYLFYTTPPSLLIFSIIALAGEFTKIDRKIKDILLLIMVWIFIPIVRVMIPGTAIYGGVRQIMEYIPAIAILS
ncbi:MAG: glycosyltransferase, partial [uncultured bacterium]